MTAAQALAAMARHLRAQGDELRELRAEVRALRDQLETRPTPGEAVDPRTVARALGVSRDWVYSHAEELGGWRLGNGDRGRWRFTLDVAIERAAGLGQAPGSAAGRAEREAT